MKDFYTLTPDRVLKAVEASGLECTGYCVALNSYENRVYEVEIENPESLTARNDDHRSLGIPNSRRRIIKFYRPRRWTKDQILEEHQFLQDLIDQEIPAIAPQKFADGSTLHTLAAEGNSPDEAPIYYALFPKVGGRAPEEWTPEQLPRLGRLLARIHNVGSARKAHHRITITPQTYGRENLQYLLQHNALPLELQRRYTETVQQICDLIDPLFTDLPPAQIHRVHGDCHPGNLLWNTDGPFFLDFDDCLNGPAVQDIWLLIPGRDAEAQEQRRLLLEGYTQMRTFDPKQLRLIEGLRALRFIHYSCWIARRYKDPAFPLAFPEFGTYAYWQDELGDLEQQLRLLQTPGSTIF